MDAFLRKVIAQREREQEEHILSKSLDVLGKQWCQGCGKEMRLSDKVRTHCFACGGRVKKVSPEGQPCARCGQAMRFDNTRGAHARCLVKPHEHSDLKKQFKAAARAKGLNPEHVITKFMISWLDTARES